MLLSTVSVHLPVFQSVPARVRRHRVHRNAGVPRVRDTEPALPNRPLLTRALCPAVFRGISLRMGSSSGPCVGGFSSLSIGLVRKLRDAKTREAGSAPAGGKGRASRAARLASWDSTRLGTTSLESCGRDFANPLFYLVPHFSSVFPG